MLLHRSSRAPWRSASLRQSLALTALGLFVAAAPLGCSEDAPLGGTGGATSGGSGGVGTGGVTGTGGSAVGGSGSGGVSTGGQSATGGTSSGGAPAGGTGGTEASGGSGGAGGSGGVGGTGGEGTGGEGTGGEGTGGGTGFSPCPSDGSACAIFPLGDSITEGFGSSGGGYRVEIFRQAVLAGHKITFVGSQQNGPMNVENQPFPRNHEGRGGYTIDTDGGHSGISGSITNDGLSNYHPHIVLLMIGTNDINGNVDVNNAPNRLDNLIGDITSRAPDSLVVVATIVPVINTGTDAKVVTYNAGVKSVVEARATQGEHVVLLDNYTVIFEQANWQNALMNDNLHPNDAGYAVLGQSFYDAIESYLP